MDYSAFQTSLRSGPDFILEEGKYRIRLAGTEEELDRIFRLRFEVFNLELKEGLSTSFEHQRDIDEFDSQFHHLLVEDQETGEIAGTYRMQDYQMATEGIGYYTARQYRLKDLPFEVLQKTVEIGRACIDQKFRNGKVLFCLWKGACVYALHRNSAYLTGCASFTGKSPLIAHRASEFFRENNFFDPTYQTDVNEEYRIDYHGIEADPFTRSDIPRLILAYLKYGVRICGPPSVDREFNTIDFPLLFDMEGASEKIKRMYFYP